MQNKLMELINEAELDYTSKLTISYYLLIEVLSAETPGSDRYHKIGNIVGQLRHLQKEK
jgi:hypothetical protein